jgi:hypothetical protein
MVIRDTRTVVHIGEFGDVIGSLNRMIGDLDRAIR